MALEDRPLRFLSEIFISAHPRRRAGPLQPVEVEEFEAAKTIQHLGFATVPAGAFLLANTLLGGSGLLGMPHALSSSGMVLGLLLIVVFGSLSAFGCHLLATSAIRIGVVPASFYAAADAVAPQWTWLIDGAVCLKCFGVATSYLIICGDLITPAAAAVGIKASRQIWISFVFFCIGAPLGTVRHLTALRYTSLAALGIVTWIVLLIILFYAGALEPCTDTQVTNFVGSSHNELFAADFEHERAICGAASALAVGTKVIDIFKAFPVIIFGFTCHQNVFTAVNEIRNATPRRVGCMIFAAYMIAVLAFAISASLGYAIYGDMIDTDVTKSFPHLGIVQVSRILFALVAIFSYPLQIHPCRLSFLALWDLVFPLGDGQVSSSRARAWRFRVTTTVLLMGSSFIALSTDNLGKVLGIVGATGSTAVTYILPGLLYRTAFPHWHLKKCLATCQMSLGCLIMPTCLAALFL